MTVSDARRLKDLESENAKLKKTVAEQMLAIEGLNPVWVSAYCCHDWSEHGPCVALVGSEPGSVAVEKSMSASHTKILTLPSPKYRQVNATLPD